MRTLLTLLLLSLSGCSLADETVADEPMADDPVAHARDGESPNFFERDAFEPGPSHTRSAELGAAPRGWVPRKRSPFGNVSGVLRNIAGGELVLQHTDIHADISAGIAIVDIAQHYTNPYDEVIETEYVLPLPPDAAVRAFRLRCGDRVIEGEIEDKDKARELYAEAKADGRKAALLEQMRENLFTQRVAGLCPGEDVVVSTQYVQQLDRSEGRTEIVFPTTVGERFNPGDTKVPTHVPAPARGGRDLSVTVSIDEGMSVASLWSDSHGLEIWEEDASGVVVTLDGSDTVPNKDFALAWTLGGEQPRGAAVVQPPIDHEDGYIALTLEPQLLEHLTRQRQRELIFVMDSSCSMSGTPWDTSVATVETAMEGMSRGDTFNLVLYSSGSTALFERPRPATAANIAAARRWLSGSFQGGGTNIESGILTSLQMPGDPDAMRLMLLLTDGYIGNEHQIAKVVQENLGEARIFGLGVGSSVNRLLLESLAAAGRGVVDYQLPNTPIDETVGTFYGRIAHPAMTDLELDWGDLDVWDTYPQTVPDLWAGQVVRVVGRYNESGGEPTVTVHGRVGGERYSLAIPVDLDGARENEAVRTLWARRQIHDITFDMALSEPQRKAQITPLALEYHLVSAYTSLIAVETQKSRCGPSTATHEVAHYGPVGTRLADPTPARSPSRPRPRPSYAPRPAPAPAPAAAPSVSPSPEPEPVATPSPRPAPAPSPAPASRPRVEGFSASGSLDGASARLLVARAMRSATRCVPAGRGHWATVTLTIADGKVTGAVLDDGPVTQSTWACLEASLKRIGFGTGSGSLSFTVRMDG